MPVFCPTNNALNKYLAPKFGVLKLDKDAAKYVFLYYLLFVKKLANAALSEAFKRRCLSASPEDVKVVAGNLCREFSNTYRLSRTLRQRGSGTSSSSSSGSERSRGISKARQQIKPAAKQKGKKALSRVDVEHTSPQAGPSRKARSMSTTEDSEEETLPAVNWSLSNKEEINEEEDWDDVSDIEVDDVVDTEQGTTSE